MVYGVWLLTNELEDKALKFIADCDYCKEFFKDKAWQLTNQEQFMYDKLKEWLR